MHFMMIPFFAPFTKSPEENTISLSYSLKRAKSDYSNSVDDALMQLASTIKFSAAYEASFRENNSSALYYSDILGNEREQAIRNALLHNVRVLDSLLLPPPLVSCVAEHASSAESVPGLDSPPATGASNYDDALNIFTHLVRDYSSESDQAHNRYNFFLSQLPSFPPNPRILIPGAGMGKLGVVVAKELRNKCSIELNELSSGMAAAANQILNLNFSGQIFPFVNEVFANEVDSRRRVEEVEISSPHHHNAISSYQIGDFVSIYAHPMKSNKFDFVLTHFFIDVIENMYELMLAVRNTLKTGGVWVNSGPLHYHKACKIRPSVDELQILLVSMGFEIVHYEVNRESNELYRIESDGTSYTKHEVYSSLEFKVMNNLKTEQLDAYRMITEGRIKANQLAEAASKTDLVKSSVVIEEL